MTAIAELTLRPYQAKVKRLAHEAIRAGCRRPLVVAPTGAGKRVQAVDWCMTVVRQNKECLFVTDRRLLIEQMADELHKHGVEFGIIMDGYLEQRTPRIQLASIQSLEARCLKRDPLTLPPADVILIDEAHKAIEQYKTLLGFYPNAYAFLLTATPVGPAGKTLIQPGYADALTEGVRNSELIQAGYLLRTRVYAPSEPNIEGIKVRNKEEFAEGALGKRVQEVTCFADVFAEWAPFADRKTIVFAPGIAYCNGLAGGPGVPGDHFYGRGIKAAVITSKVKAKDRDAIIRDFADGDLKVLISVDVLREGFDVPKASCAIDLQPNAQLRTYWQKIGRVKRPFGDQQFAVYIDMAGNYWRFPHPDDDPDWLAVTGETTTQDVIAKRLESGKASKQVMCPKCSAVRKGGPRCPECGHEAQERDLVRRIRMGNGKLREVPAQEKRKHEKTEAQRQADKWKSSLFIGLKCGKTLKQCAWLHKSKHGDWPGRELPCVPEMGSASWSLKVDQVYTAKDIMREFSNREH